MNKAAQLVKMLLESAYVQDVKIGDLDPDTKKDVLRFVASTSKTLSFPLYGMVVSELLPKVDQHNYATAKEHVKDQEVDKEEVIDKAKTKHILLVNDKIIDGHHFLCKAEKAGVTSSLKVLDLTPARFQ